MLKVKDVMDEEAKIVNLEMTIKKIIEIFAQGKSSFIIVKNNNQEFIGILTKKKLLQLIMKNCNKDCDFCIEDCPTNVLQLGSNRIVVNGEQCNVCELCRKNCKFKIEMNTQLKEIIGEEIISKVKKINYNHSLNSDFKKLFNTDFSIVVDDQDQIIGSISKVNITNKIWKKTCQKVNELQTILNSTSNAIIAIDNQGKITICNDSAKNMLGIATEEVKGREIEEVLPTTGLLEVLKTGEEEHSKKLKLDNTIAISNRTPIIDDDNGEILGAVGVFQDISKIEKVHEELEGIKELNMELEAIIESSYDGIYITDGEGYTLRINDAYKRITGLDEDVIGEHMKDLQDKGIISKSVSLLVMDEKEPVTIMQTIKGEKDVIVTGNPIFDEAGNLIRVVTNVRDITELNNLKQKLRKAEERSSKYYQELTELRLQQKKDQEIVFKSKAMEEVLNLALQVSKFNSTVLISGESGVGKELVAKFIHRSSTRNGNSFIKVNCGAIPENLLESELFGYAKGAFTGANEEGKKGKFQLAHGGTLFLDEIGELPLNLQVKILRAIQEKEVMQVGGTEPIKVDIRIIAATNRNLEEMVARGDFREDLFYRLNVVPISVPPLRERKSDIPVLTIEFLEKLRAEYDLEKEISASALDLLIKYQWPGNVRELKNVIERLFITVKEKIIRKNHLPQKFLEEEGNEKIKINGLMPLKEAVERVEKVLVNKALDQYGSTRKAGEKLKVHQSTIVRKKQKYNLGDAK